MKRRTPNPESIERVAVRGVNWVGDAVMSVAALRELRRVFPAARITLVTRAWAKDIFEGVECIDDIMLVGAGHRGVRGFARQLREWRAARFDLAILFPNSFEPALLASLARVPLRAGYATDGRRALLTHAFTPPAWRDQRHEVFYYLNLVAELERAVTGASHVDESEPQTRLEVSPARKDEAREFLRGHGIKSDRPLVALCPGSTNSRAKRWPPERYAALADMLIEEAGAEVLLIGAREEAEASAEVASHMRKRPHVLTGRTSLAETTAILSVVDLLVTNDTGPAHIVSALERPALVIFGPTNPLTTRPFSPLAEVIRRPPECAPCMLRDCPIDHRCMTAITSEEVFARALQRIGRRVGAEVAR